MRVIVQPPAQSRVSLGIRCGFIQLHLGNLWGRRLHNLSGQPTPLLGCPPGEKDFAYI